MTRYRSADAAIRIALLFALVWIVPATWVSAQDAEKTPEETADATAPAEVKPTAEQASRATEHAAGPHHPPTSGKMVGDHWTPYTPPDPESFPQGSQVHIIEKGDTLWDLSAKYLTNAWLWPQIWDVNQYITDSHWIYPGDPILLPGAPTVITEAPPAPAPPAAPPAEEAGGMEAEPAPPAPMPPSLPPPPALAPAATNADLYCSNQVVAEWQPPALFIAEREEGAKTVLSPGDIVYLSQGEQDGVAPGQIFTIIRPEHPVYHPARVDELIGTSVRSVGRLQILAVQPRSATAELIDGCTAVVVGDYLTPFQEIPVPLSGPVAFERFGLDLKKENSGYIIHVLDDQLSFGQGDIVNVDLGSDQGLQPGDVLIVYREWPGKAEFASAKMYIDVQQQKSAKKPVEGAEEPIYRESILGQIVILGTQSRSATAKILVSVRDMTVGDRVELR